MRVSSTNASGRAPPIIIGAFGVSGLHSLVVNPGGARQSQHAKKSSPPTKGGKPLRNKKDEGEEKTGWRRVGKGQAQVCVYSKFKNRPTQAFASWHDWVCWHPSAPLSFPPSSRTLTLIFDHSEWAEDTFLQTLMALS